MESKKPSFRLYLDETMVRSNIDQERRWFALAGCLLTLKEHARKLRQPFESIKSRYFTYHSEESPVILHRIDMCCPSPRGAFSVLRDESRRDRFYDELLTIIENCDFRIIFAVSEIRPYPKDVWKTDWRTLGYLSCLDSLLDTYCEYLNEERSQGDVMASHLGMKENLLLKAKYQMLFEGGSSERFPSFFKRSLSSRDLKIERKEKNVAGLQLADLVAAPVVRSFLSQRTGIDHNHEAFSLDLAGICKSRTVEAQARRLSRDDRWLV